MRGGALALTALVFLLGAAPAGATTLFVSTTGNDADTCLSAAHACHTVSAAITKGENAPDTFTVNVAAGNYTEDLNLSNSSDAGATIVGAGSGAGGTQITGVDLDPTVRGAGVSLRHLAFLNPAADTSDGLDLIGGDLSDVAVTMQHAGTNPAISTLPGSGPVTFTGGTVTMQNSTGGTGISAGIAPLTLSGVRVNVPPGSAAGAVSSIAGALTVSNSQITLGPEADIGIFTGGERTQLDHVSVVGGRKRDLQMSAGSVADSRFVTDSGSTRSAALFSELIPGGHDVAVTRSVFQQANPVPSEAAVLDLSTDLLLDSSELLGGAAGLNVVHGSGKLRSVTLVSSLIDAGAAGTRDAAPGVQAINAQASGSAGGVLNVNVEGSILLERSLAGVADGATLRLACSYSDVPDQAQAADATQGTIACQRGAAGNSTTDPLGGLFAASDYSLVPGSSAVDSVPESAIVLAPPFTSASTTDLAGNPRLADADGDCAPVRDKGPLELAGHGGTPAIPRIGGPDNATVGVPVTLTGAAQGGGVSYSWSFSDGGTASGTSVAHTFSRPGGAGATLTVSGPGDCAAVASHPISVLAGSAATPALSHLTIRPHAFFPARSGPSISRATGATVSYTERVAADTTFTVLQRKVGHRRGRSCVTVGRRHGRATCTVYVSRGTFIHHDVAGSNSFHFWGRVFGATLRRGEYRLDAVPRAGGMAGPSVSTSFAIRS